METFYSEPHNTYLSKSGKASGSPLHALEKRNDFASKFSMLSSDFSSSFNAIPYLKLSAVFERSILILEEDETVAREMVISSGSKSVNVSVYHITC